MDSNIITYMYIYMYHFFLLMFSVEVQVYLAKRSVIDLSNSSIWVISLATLIIASVWPDLIPHEKSDEEYDELSPKVTT